MFNGLIIFVFVTGYLAIMLEHKTGVNKAAVALLMGVVCWVMNFIRSFPNDAIMIPELNEHLADISQVVIFVLGTMMIIELVEAYRGFGIIADFIRTKNKRELLWVVSFITFFISSFLANMTVAIIMITLLRRFIPERNDRMIFASMVIIASNAGGAWTPIGDTTTTMLWLGKQISTGNIMKWLLLPSLVSVLVPCIYFSYQMRKEATVNFPGGKADVQPMVRGAKRVFFIGITGIILVPVLNAATNLPPYMGILLVLGIMWALTDLIHQERHFLRVTHVMGKIDGASVLFFLGILLSVAALETAGLLKTFAVWMDKYFVNKDVIVTILGMVSSVVDNIPLTAAAMGMYDLTRYPMDSKLWELTAYAVGTGGSLLIIGSAAGVVVMGMEKISFSWYLKRISFPALIGYLAGIFTFLIFYR